MNAVFQHLARLQMFLGGSSEPPVEFTVSPWRRLGQIHGPHVRQGLRFLASPTLSFLLHAGVLFTFAQIPVKTEPPRPALQEVLVTESEPEEEPAPLDPEFELAKPSDETSENLLSSLAMSMAALQADDAQLDAYNRPIDTSEIEPHEFQVTALDEVRGFLESETLVRKGTVGAEEVSHVEGAVDRLTFEIMNQLKEGKLLVTWMMDASLSLAGDRAEVSRRLELIYDQLHQLEPSRDALRSAVVSFGETVKEMTGPTHDARKVVQAIENVPNDESGVENVFQSVIWTVERYRVFRSREQRRLLVIIWTDESGDDYTHLEDAVALCQRLSATVLVVGPSAMFGNEKGQMAYKHPDDGQVYMLPVCRGPDAVRQERIKLPYWFEGPQYESLHSGLSPFALGRLTSATGGVYLIKDHEADASPFRLDAMDSYRPEYISPQEYMKRATASPLRSAVLQAVDLTHKRKMKGTPRLMFAPTANNFQQELREAQESVAYDTMILDEALAFFGAKGLETAYEKETSPRWRAWYDLTYGRLLALRVRCNEYNWACAEMKGKGQEFVAKESNRWKFVPSEKLKFGSASTRQGAEALRLLQRCVDRNPDTPWAKLAQRELSNPLGFEVEESYVAPPPPPKPMARPPANPPPPRMPDRTRRTEQPQKLKPPEEVKLPKL